MPKDKLEALGHTQANRRTVLKGLLVGLGAGVLVQASGGVTSFAQQDQPKAEKSAKKKIEKSGEEHKKIDGEHKKIDGAKTDTKSDSKAKNEKKKTEEPKNQHKK